MAAGWQGHSTLAWVFPYRTMTTELFPWVKESSCGCHPAFRDSCMVNVLRCRQVRILGKLGGRLLLCILLRHLLTVTLVLLSRLKKSIVSYSDKQMKRVVRRRREAVHTIIAAFLSPQEHLHFVTEISQDEIFILDPEAAGSPQGSAGTGMPDLVVEQPSG